MGLQVAHRTDQLQPRTQRSLGVVFVSLWITEVNQHAVAHSPLQLRRHLLRRPPTFCYRSDRRPFASSFLAPEVQLLEDKLAERYEAGCAGRKDFVHQPYFCFRPRIKISASIATTFSDRKQPNSDADRVDLSLQKNVIRSTIATSNPTVASLADRDTRQGSSALMTNRRAGFYAVTRPAPRSYGTVGPSRNFLKSGWRSRHLKSSARGGPIFPVSCHLVGSEVPHRSRYSLLKLPMI